jgi:uncharacterized protein YgiM (DUF1202 family)
MKTNCWLILGTMIATSAVAQVNTNTLPEVPAPATAAPAATESANPSTPAPAKKKAEPKKKAAKPVKKISEPTVSLVPGPATVTSEILHLRGQAGMKGETVGSLKKGDTVTVISQITLDKHAADEPAQWAKIALPSGTKVWINSHFVDKANKVVKATQLHLRAGPGENYSALGMLEKGATFNQISTKGDWIQIETPANACAFVAAMFLKQEAPAPIVAANPIPVVETPVAPTPAPTPRPIIVAETPQVAPAPVQPLTEPNVGAAQKMEATDAKAAVDTNAPPRVISHEGYVRSATSPVAPTYYELFDWDSGNTINYLYSPTTNLDLGRYNGYKVIVTGEEGMTARWASTPVLTIQKIFVLETHYPQDYKRVASPRGEQQQIIRVSKPQQRR